jgi:cytochrome P450
MTKEDGVIAINSTILAFTMDVIASVGFGQELNSVTNGNNEMGNDILNLFQVAYIRYFSPIKYWKIPLIGQYLDGGGGSKTRLLNALTRLVNDYKASSKSGKSSEDYSKKAKTFLGKVVALNMKDPEALNTERLVGNLLTIFLAGAETSHVTIVSSLYEIASDKTGLQDELAAEAHALGDLETASTNELMEKLPRMRSLVNEILRIKGPVAFLGLENVEPLEIEGTMIPANSNIVLAMQYISCQESKIIGKGTPPGPRFANPRDFCPRRWLIDSDGKPYDGDACTVLSPAFKTGFRAFGSGMRVCPGRLLAEIEILVVLSAILCKFEISLEDGHPPMALITSFTEQPDIDIRLVLKARK